ncbi:MAG: hypothetical protein COB51_04825 [Moraxellaceae bacterium]|nr:MAG: hypothetical protein COB51_04825 [Moraxellaceae bacterium]
MLGSIVGFNSLVHRQGLLGSVAEIASREVSRKVGRKVRWGAAKVMLTLYFDMCGIFPYNTRPLQDGVDWLPGDS